jgi:hypothetical protein
MKQLLVALPLALMFATQSTTRADNIEVAASMRGKTLGCQSAKEFMQMIDHIRSNRLQAAVNDMTIYFDIGECIDLQQGQSVYIESEPLDDLLCVRPKDKSICYWAPSTWIVRSHHG